MKWIEYNGNIFRTKKSFAEEFKKDNKISTAKIFDYLKNNYKDVDIIKISKKDINKLLSDKRDFVYSTGYVENKGKEYKLDDFLNEIGISKGEFDKRYKNGFQIDAPLKRIYKKYSKFDSPITETKVGNDVSVIYKGKHYNSIKEFCKEQEISEVSYYKWRDEGKLPGVSPAKQVRVIPSLDAIPLYDKKIMETQRMVANLTAIKSVEGFDMLPEKSQKEITERINEVIQTVMEVEKDNRIVTFDLDTNKLKKIYDKKYNGAYLDISKYLREKDFAHPQGSGYVTNKPITRAEVLDFLIQIQKDLPWLNPCLKSIALAVEPEEAKELLDNIAQLRYKEQERTVKNLLNSKNSIEESTKIRDLYSMSEWRQAVKEEGVLIESMAENSAKSKDVPKIKSNKYEFEN